MSQSEEKILESIHQELELLPAAFLESVLHIIRAIRLHAPVTTPVSAELLQAYADKFREGFSFFFKGGTAWNISKGNLSDDLLYMSFEGVDSKDFIPNLREDHQDLMQLLNKNEGSLNLLIQKIEDEGKAILYEETRFIVVKKNLPEAWTIDEATKDAREELGKILQSLPNGTI